MAGERIMIFDVGEQCEYRYPARVNHFDGNGNHTFTDEEIVCHLESQWGEECDDNRCEKCDKKQCIGISHQEAIELIAGALHKYEFTHSKIPTWCELNDDIKNDYRKQAQAALNALLLSGE